MNTQVKGLGALLLSTFLYGFYGVLIKIIGFQIPLFFGMTTRNLALILILATLVFLTKTWTTVDKKDWKWILLRCLFGQFSFIGSYIAFFYIPIGTAYFIFYGGSTISGYLIGSLFFKEKITPIKIVSLVMALVGLFLIYATNFDLHSNGLYALLSLVAGFLASVWNTFSKKVSDKYSAYQLSFWDAVGSFGFSLAAFLITKESAIPFAFNLLWGANILFMLMFLATGIFMVIGFKYIEVQIGSLIMLSEILFGILCGFFLLHESLSLMTFVGGAIIISAIILPEIKWKPKSLIQKETL